MRAIEARLPEAAAGQLVNTSASAPNLCLAITVCPWLRPDEFRAHVPGGYPGLLDQVCPPAIAQGAANFVHLIYCTGNAPGAAGLHMFLATTGSEHVTVSLPLDLLTAEELSRFGV